MRVAVFAPGPSHAEREAATRSSARGVLTLDLPPEPDVDEQRLVVHSPAPLSGDDAGPRLDHLVGAREDVVDPPAEQRRRAGRRAEVAELSREELIGEAIGLARGLVAGVEVEVARDEHALGSLADELEQLEGLAPAAVRLEGREVDADHRDL